ncbi:MAG: phosphoserine phosphatase RsbU/P, partial [Abditibacteriota bacterium]|nr:phosphoserine phosphatase RsbU/P [Abditibacteriota bacterium]
MSGRCHPCISEQLFSPVIDTSCMAHLPKAPVDNSTSTFASLLARLRRRGWEPVRSNAVLDGRQRASWGMGIGLCVALITLLLLQFHPLGTKLEYDTLDFCFQLRGKHTSQKVAILAADDATLRRWNGRVFDDREIGRLLRLLKAHRVRAAALAFPALTDSSWPFHNRAQFAHDLKSSGIAHLPLALNTHNKSQAASPVPEYLEHYSWPHSQSNASLTKHSIGALPAHMTTGVVGMGHTTFGWDDDGRPRKSFPSLPAQTRNFPSLAVSAAAQVRGQSARAVAQELSGSVSESMLLNFPKANDGRLSFPTLSIARVLQQPELLKAWAGRAVVIGPAAAGTTPFYISPHNGHVSKAQLHAIELDNILSDNVLRTPPLFWSWLLTMLACAIVGGFVAARPPLWSAPVALLALGTVFLLAIGLFAHNVWLNVAAPTLGIGLTYASGVIGRARREAREATHIGSTIEAITQVSEIITAQTKSDELLDLVLAWTVHVMRAEGASALLLDASGEKLHFAATTGPVAKQLMPFTLNLGEGIAGWVTQTGEAVVVNDVHRDKRFKKDIDEAIGFTTRSILCLPLRVHDRILGAVEVINRIDGSRFTEDDVELLAAVANQAAVVLDNARLYAMLSERVMQSESELAVTNQRLEAEKNLLHTVLQSMTEGVVVTDIKGRIQLVNPTAAQLLPELDRGVIGLPLHEVLSELSLSAAHSPGNILESATGPATEILSSRHGGLQLLRGDIDSPRIIESQSAPLRGTDGALFGGVTVFADVTEERR